MLRVETKWTCWNRGLLRTGTCEGTMVVIGMDDCWSVRCSKCSIGANGKGPLHDSYLDRLVEEGYIMQLSKRPADREDLRKFFTGCVRGRRSAQEITDDLLERFEVFIKDHAVPKG